MDTACDLYANGKYAGEVLEKAYGRIETGKTELQSTGRDRDNKAKNSDNKALKAAAKENEAALEALKKDCILPGFRI